VKLLGRESFSDRYALQAQGQRRKKMAIARNWLMLIPLKPTHSWVHWRHINVETYPWFDRDVVVLNIWRPLRD
jgi:mannan polymerase II complex ANP1 subunit